MTLSILVSHGGIFVTNKDRTQLRPLKLEKFDKKMKGVLTIYVSIEGDSPYKQGPLRVLSKKLQNLPEHINIIGIAKGTLNKKESALFLTTRTRYFFSESTRMTVQEEILDCHACRSQDLIKGKNPGLFLILEGDVT